ncbi:MAG: type II CAAX endopeptidase family protein [Spirochaetia bacterium]|jgi:membrane protease YdiL (CAAX protease family)|nr:type II CAAX endopeptidase family protein [Spirochaetia bacterium]
MNTETKKTAVFLALTFIVCLPFYILISRNSGEFYIPSIIMIMWAPGLSAIAVKLIFDKNLRRFGWKPGKLKYLGLGYILPLFGGILVYGIVWTTGAGELNIEKISENFMPRILMAATLGVFVSILTAAGEEIGWRGFLLPEILKRYSPLKTSLIVSVIWALYHYPGIFFSSYTSGTGSWYAVLFFTLQIIGLTFIMTWLWIKSGSLWPAVILHASHNLFIQSVFDSLTKDTGETIYFTTDFGVGLALFYGAAAVLLWKRKKIISTA